MELHVSVNINTLKADILKAQIHWINKNRNLVLSLTCPT